MKELGTGCWACARPVSATVTMWPTGEGLVCDNCVCASLEYITRSARAMRDAEARRARDKIFAAPSLNLPSGPALVRQTTGHGRVRRVA